MLPKQEHLVLSDHSYLYDILIKKDNMLRRINEMIDFSFVRKELEGKYCPDNGRMAEDPVRMFKYLLLKVINPQSDVDLVKRAYTDMSYKYFLGLAPEDDVIDPSLLTKFRRQRLKDSDLLGLLIGKTVAIAISKGIIKGKSTLIVDSTHSVSGYNLYKPWELLKMRMRALVKACHPFFGDSLKEKDLKLGRDTTDYRDGIADCRRAIAKVEASGMRDIPAISSALHLLEESIDDMEHFSWLSKDSEARVGHKTANSKFFGYKEHLGLTTERIITAAVVTTGEHTDGNVLPDIVRQSEDNGLKVESLIGDAAYSGKDNIKLCQDKGIDLTAPLNPVISNGNRKGKEFEYNKDAKMFVCPAGHMAVRKQNGPGSGENHNRRVKYFFDVIKCRECPLREGCYREGAKTKSYVTTIMSDEHKKMLEAQNTPEFKRKMKERYKIEEKNSELKNVYGLKKTMSFGLESMQLQTAMAIFAANIKRILKLSGN
jgi:transposase